MAPVLDLHKRNTKRLGRLLVMLTRPLAQVRVAGSLRFSACQALQIKRNQLPPRPKINEAEITEVFIKGGGNGGQKINKTNSKVQLKHLPTGIVVESQFSRSRDDNRKRAREILALKLEEIELGGASRAAVVAEYKRQKARKKKQKGRKRQKEREEAKEAVESPAEH